MKKRANKVLLFYNPYAGNGVIKNNLDVIIERFQKKGMFVIPIRADYSENRLDSVFRRICIDEYRKLIAAGGDGTIHSIVNAMIRNEIDIPLAIFPAGTANDFASYMDLPNKLDDMIGIALEEKYTKVDVGIAGGRCFVNVLAMGMLADVSQKTDPNLKNTLGLISYYLKGVSELPNLRPVFVRVSCEAFNLEANIYFMLVMNGRSAGGFRRLAPDAVMDDGLLDVMIFREMPIMELAPLLIAVMTGQHPINRNVISFKTASLRIESDRKIATDLDGEAGDLLPVEVSVLHKRLRVNTRKDDMEASIW
ncbi:MAG: YegS/Rv2252/BmrU family lipid kinase [Clostridiales Family XIII bacterium]|jgi:YegS/Rv2252/BmrU family lipid kinase|nr:YegS/Rv2252/BmrU family lipid kinase [Clostridiales Family XIII bacterium]